MPPIRARTPGSASRSSTRSSCRSTFRAGDAIGRHIGFGTDPGTKTPIEIVGVVSDAKYTDVRAEIRRQVFFPYLEDRNAGGFMVYARTRQDTATAMTRARRIVQQLDANIPCRSCARWSARWTCR